MTQGQLPSVWLIILNWNQSNITLDCLASVLKSDYTNYHIVVIDNGSTDNSVQSIHSRFPSVNTIENESNLGVAVANNMGIRFALSNGAQYVCLLNNDTVIAPDMLSLLIQVAESHPKIAATGPKMYFFDEPEKIWCAGGTIDWKMGSIHKGNGEFDRGNESYPEPVAFIPSCALCIKAEAFKSIGLMDERWFIYYDDTDWCTRAVNKGWQIFYTPQAKLWHRVSAAMKIASPATDYYMTRNIFLFLYRNFKGVYLWRALSYALYGNTRTIVAYFIMPQKRHLVRNRTARLLAIRDMVLGRWGEMGPDVRKVCYPSESITKKA